MNKKKLLCLGFLLINILICSASVRAESASDDEAGLLSALNIVTDKFIYSDAITRGDFAIAISNAMNSGFGEDYQTLTNPFSDLYKYEPYSGAFEYLKGVGVLQGDGDNKFNKRVNITVEQAYIIALRALGYGFGPNAELPQSPLSLAASAKINVDKALTAPLSGSDAVHIIYKMLFVKNFYEPTVLTVDKDRISETFLKYYWDVDEVEGVVLSDGITHIYSEASMSKGNCRIGNISCLDPDGITLGLSGYNVKAYIDEDDTVLYAVKHRNKDITISADDMNDPYENDYRIKYDEGGSTRTLKLSKAFALVYNGFAADNLDNIIPEEGEARLIDNDNDGEYDVVFVDEWRYMFVRSINISDQEIIDHNNKKFKLDLDDDDAGRTIVVTEADTGMQLALEDISSDTVIRCITDREQIKIIAYTERKNISGRITAINKQDRIVVIDGTEYKYNGYYRDYYQDCSIGTAGYFYFGDDNTITALKIDNEASSDMRYGYIIKAGVDEQEENMFIRLIDDAGDYIKIILSDSCVIDGKKIKNIGSTMDKSVEDAFFYNGFTKYQLVRYSCDENNNCRKIDTTVSNHSYEKFCMPPNMDDCLQLTNIKDSRKYKSLDKLFLPVNSGDSFRLTDETKTFFVPSTIGTRNQSTVYDNDEFEVGSQLKNDTKYTVEAYNIDKSGAVAAAVVYAETQPSVGTSSDCAVVYSAFDYWDDEEGLITTKLVCFDGAKFKDILLTEKAVKQLNESGTRISKGDVIRYDLNIKGKANVVNLEYHHVKNSVFATSGEDGAYEITKLVPRYEQDGYLVGMNGEKQNVYKIDNAAIVEVEGNERLNVKASNTGAIKCSSDYDDECSEIILIMTYSSPKLIIVYNE